MEPTPPSVQRVVVEASSQPGTRLASDGSISGEDEYGALLLAFSPQLVLFPDATPDDPTPPFPEGPRDYHPRPVEAFLKAELQTGIATPTGVLRAVLVVLVPLTLVGIPLAIVLWLNGFSTPLALPIVAAAAFALFISVQFSQRALPSSAVALRSWLAAMPDEQRRSRSSPLAISAIKGPSPIPRQDAWDRYRKDVAGNDASYPRTVYGRSVDCGGDVFLQYWQFYPFNDWNNWHEADWEVVMVRLGRCEHKLLRPIAAIYSSHLGGLWRGWDDVQQADATVPPDGICAEHGAVGHPVAFVARGSHAQYFAAIPEGYPAVLNQSIGPARFQISTDWTDVVADAPDDVSPLPYRLRAMPRLDSVRATKPDWSDWWWLRFFGAWGAHEGVPGPQAQNPKWDDPQTWGAMACVGDPGSWQHLAGSAP